MNIGGSITRPMKVEMLDITHYILISRSTKKGTILGLEGPNNVKVGSYTLL